MDEYREEENERDAAADEAVEDAEVIELKDAARSGEAITNVQDEVIDERETMVPKTRPGWRELFFALGLIWPAELFVGITVVGISRARGYESFTENGFDIDPWAVVVTVPISAAATLLACWLFACRRFGRTFRDGMYFYPVARDALKWSALLGIGWSICGIVTGFFLSTGEAPITDLVLRPSAEDPNEASLYYPIFALFILVPILEEIYYRGFLFTVFENTIGPRWALCVVTLWFGLVHAPQIGGAIEAILVVMIAGALFTWLRYRYASLIPSLVCHVAYNGTIVLFGLVAENV